MKRKVLIPIDQQTEETPQTSPSVETTDSNLKSEDLFVTNDFIPTDEEKEEMPMSEEKFPTIDTNLFGSTSSDSSEKDDWTFNTKEATKKQTQVADDFRQRFASYVDQYKPTAQQTEPSNEPVTARRQRSSRSSTTSTSSTTTERLFVDRWLLANTSLVRTVESMP